MRKTKIGKGCSIDNSIISWGCSVGNWVRIEGLTSIAEDVKVKDEVRVTECKILSHKSVSENTEKSILM